MPDVDHQREVVDKCKSCLPWSLWAVDPHPLKWGGGRKMFPTIYTLLKESPL